MTLGSAIAAKRHDAGMTRAALASKAGLSPNTLMKIEQGQTVDPGVLKVAAVCRALAISLDELIRSSDQLRHEVQMSHGIISAGYEGRSLDDFVSALQELGVGTVADVRLNAISRKAGFSKSQLQDALSNAGIGYRHMRSLGNAKENRKPFWSGQLDEGRRVFREALQEPAAEEALHELADLASDHLVAILCFEADPGKCHRQVVIDEVVEARHLPVADLRP